MLVIGLHVGKQLAGMQSVGQPLMTGTCELAAKRSTVS
jgi:hypothetical protein